MKMEKKGQASISRQVTGVIIGVVSVVILVSMAPELWTVLDDALGNISTANIPFISNMTGLIGLLFGVSILLGAIYGIMKLVQTRR